MSKRAIFILLGVLAAICLALAVQRHEDDLKQPWSQGLWIIVGAMATSFILESLLERDQAARAHAADGLALRTFTANLLSSILATVKTTIGAPEDLWVTAVSDKHGFARLCNIAAQAIERSSDLDGDAYNQHYLEVSSGLRNLGRDHIRLFSSSEEEMVANYRALVTLAGKWDYRASLSLRFLGYTNSLQVGSDERREREEETTANELAAKSTAKHTALLLAQLTQKAAMSREVFRR